VGGSWRKRGGRKAEAKNKSNTGQSNTRNWVQKWSPYKIYRMGGSWRKLGGSTAEALRKHNNMERSEVKADMFKLFLIEFVCFGDF